MATQQFLEININNYQSPLDLIYHLIEINDIDIYNIPIFDITEQYLTVLKSNSLNELDMELASEFLVMAATLMQIKSRMLLPHQKTDDNSLEGNDPREELVLRLLAYKRNKFLAEELEKEYNLNKGSKLKNTSEPHDLGIDIEIVEDKLDINKFAKAIDQLEKRNSLRFSSQNQRIRQLLRREKFSVKDKMKEVIQRVFEKTRMFFSELFPVSKSTKPERISGFLAILELIRQNKIIVKQASPFSVMMIELEEETKEKILESNSDEK